MQRFWNISFGRTILGSNFGGPLARTNFLSALCGLPKLPGNPKVSIGKRLTYTEKFFLEGGGGVGLGG